MNKKSSSMKAKAEIVSKTKGKLVQATQENKDEVPYMIICLTIVC